MKNEGGKYQKIFTIWIKYIKKINLKIQDIIFRGTEIERKVFFQKWEFWKKNELNISFQYFVVVLIV